MSNANSNGNGRGVLAVSYIRMSSDKQDASPQQQRDELAKLAARGGYHVLREYLDEAISGDATDKRVGFQTMMRDAQRGEFNAILCWDQDRFGRFDSVEAGYYIHPLRQAGVKLVTVAQGEIDWTDFAGRMLYSIQQEGKHQFLLDLARNSLRGKVAAARRGEWVTRAPLGLTIKNKTLALGDPQDVATVRRMFTAYLTGHSLRAVASALNADGIRTRRGRLWNGDMVRKILRNVAYIGTYRWGDGAAGKYSSYNGEPIVLENHFPAIIDRKSFDAVQQRLAERKTATTPHKNGGKFVFSGLCWCGKCGARMTGATTKPTVRYRCHAKAFSGVCDTNAVGQEELIDAVGGAVERHFREPKTIERFRVILAQRLKQQTKPTSVDNLKRQLSKLDDRLTKAQRRLVEVDADMIPVVTHQIRDLRAERDQLADAVKAAQRPRGRVEADQDARIGRAVKMLVSLQQTLRRADPVKQRELLALCVERIEVWSKRDHSGNTKYALERGRIYLRSDMWLGDNLSDSPK